MLKQQLVSSMRKLIFILLFLPSLLRADWFQTQFKVAYFRPDSSIMRDIYGSAWTNLGVNFTFPYRCGFNGFFGFNYMHEHGSSIGAERDTRISMYPFTLGFRYLLYVNQYMNWYVGLNGKAVYIRVKNDRVIAKKRVFTWAPGGGGEVGATFWVTSRLSFELFADYYYAQGFPSINRLGVEEKSEAVGGLSLGSGLGFLF